jgi:DNA-binding SARP family transcriptional activator
LNGPRCDAVLEIDGSAELLAELADLGLLAPAEPVEAVDLERTWKHHEMLRQALLAAATVRLGKAELRRLHSRAGEVLASEGRPADAVVAFALAGEWVSVKALVASNGPDLAGAPGRWLTRWPLPLRDGDPWVMLSLARRQVSEGAFTEAAETYRRARSLADPEVWAANGRAEAHALMSWLDPPPGGVGDWVVLLRRALNAPGEVLSRLSSPGSPGPPAGQPGQDLALGVAYLVSGRVVQAAALLDDLTTRPELPAVVETLALLVRAVAVSALLDPRAPTARRQAGQAAAALGSPAVSRLVEGLDLVCTGGGRLVSQVIGQCRAAGDVWGAALLQVLQVVATMPAPSPDPAYQHLARGLDDLGACALALWVDVCTSMARATDRAAGDRNCATDRDAPGSDPLCGRPTARRERPADLARRAAELGPLPAALVRMAGEPGRPGAAAAGIADPAVRVCLGRGVAWLRLVGRAVMAGREVADPRSETAPTGQITVRCLGGFAVLRGDVPVDLGRLRPRHRALLRVLALHAGQSVHRERLMEWFWPEHDPVRASRNLQVAVSAVRQVVESGDHLARLVREGECYRLDLGPGYCDVVELEELAGRVKRTTPGSSARESVLETMLDAVTGEVLPDDACSDWASGARDRVRALAVEASLELADLQAADGRHDIAARTAARGLAHDRYADPLWQRLTESLGQAGWAAAAAAARRDYESLVAELVSGTQAEPASAVHSSWSARVADLPPLARGDPFHDELHPDVRRDHPSDDLRDQVRNDARVVVGDEGPHPDATAACPR